MVELAVVVPVLVLFLFGIIDFGSVYSNQISVRQGVREGARQGAVANFGSTNCSSGSFTISAGPPALTTPSTDIQDLMCLVKQRVGLGTSNVYVKVVFDTSYAVNNGLIVCAQSPAQSITGLTSQILGSTFLKTKVEMTIEKVSGSTEVSGEEVPPSGANWSWCSGAGATP